MGKFHILPHALAFVFFLIGSRDSGGLSFRGFSTISRRANPLYPINEIKKCVSLPPWSRVDFDISLSDHKFYPSTINNFMAIDKHTVFPVGKNAVTRVSLSLPCFLFIYSFLYINLFYSLF